MKKQFSIKFMSVVMALAISFSTLFIAKNNISASANGSAESILPYTEDTELFSWDCNNQSVFNSTWSPYMYGYLGNLNSLKNEEDNNVYLEFTQSNCQYASLPLGYKYLYQQMWFRTDNANYTWSGAYDSTLQLKPGVTYEVSYKYKNEGTVVYDLTVGLAVGYVTYIDGTDATTCKNNFADANKRLEQYRPDFKCKSETVTYSTGEVLNVTDWAEQKAYITIPIGTEIGERDRLYITFEGGGVGTTKPHYYIDDIKVTALAPDYLFKYNTDGGTNADGSDYYEYSFSFAEDQVKLPEDPVKDGYIFGGWYTDEALTKAYNPSEYQAAQSVCQTVNLYAKWIYVGNTLYDVGDFSSENSPYYGLESFQAGNNEQSNSYNSCRWSVSDEANRINGENNGMIKYKYTQSSVKNIVGEATGSTPGLNTPVALLQGDSHDKFVLTPNTKYTISFDYYVAATGGNTGENAQIVLARSYPDADYTLNNKPENYKMLINKFSQVQYYDRGAVLVDATQKSTEWKNISYTFTTFAWDESTKFNGIECGNWNLLSLSGLGYGEIYIDNIKIYSDGAVSTVNDYFQNGMLFQQNKPMTIWGQTESVNSAISAKLYLNGNLLETQNATVAEDLSWQLEFTPRNGSYDKYYITILENNIVIGTLFDVLVGELWLASGQSNMQYYVINDNNPDLYEGNKNIRIYDFQSPKSGYKNPLPASEQTETNGKWRIPYNAAATTCPYVSAVAYSTCLNLQKELDIPVGFINAAKGSTPIETWLSRSSIEGNETVKSGLQENNKYYTKEEIEAYAATGGDDIGSNWKRMTVMYNNIIAPISRTNIAGVLWYQGESNINDKNRATLYRAELCELATSYSKTFGFEDGTMPFVFAHIAPFYYRNLSSTTIPEFSETLSNAVEDLKGKVKAMQVPIYDLPLDYKDGISPIHPSHKYEVGARFAAVLLKENYSVNTNSYLAPEYDSMEVSGNRIIVTFKNVGDGLTVLNNGSRLKGFKISGSNGVFVNAEAAIINSNQVAVWSLGVAEPTAVTYAWDNLCTDASLGNSIGVPAVAFRTNANIGNKYQLSNAWLDLDKQLKWKYSDYAQSGEYVSVWKSSDSDAISFVGGIINGSALKITHSAQGTSFEPELNCPNSEFSLSGTSAINVVINNNDKSAKTLTLSVESGGKTYSLKANGGNDEKHTVNSEQKIGIYRFSTTELYDESGALVTGTEEILSNITRIYFNISGTEGSILVDDIIISTDAPSETLMSGDSNGDDTIDIRDLVHMFANKSSSNNNETVMDLNKDGYINAVDSTSLRRFLLS